MCDKAMKMMDKFNPSCFVLELRMSTCVLKNVGFYISKRGKFLFSQVVKLIQVVQNALFNKCLCYHLLSPLFSCICCMSPEYLHIAFADYHK